MSLFLRSRRTFTVVIFIGLVVGTQAVLGRFQVRVGSTDPRFVPLALLLGPALLAGLIGFGAASPMEPWDRLGGRRVAVARGLHVGGLLAVTAVVLAVLTPRLDEGHTAVAVVRNLLGLSGVVLVAVGVVGSAVSWVPPVLLAGAALVIGASGPGNGAWSWLLRPDGSRPAAGVALLLAAAGWSVLTWRGERGPAALASVGE